MTSFGTNILSFPGYITMHVVNSWNLAKTARRMPVKMFASSQIAYDDVVFVIKCF